MSRLRFMSHNQWECGSGDSSAASNASHRTIISPYPTTPPFSLTWNYRGDIGENFFEKKFSPNPIQKTSDLMYK